MEENFRIIGDINRLGIIVLLVEQIVRQSPAIAHHGYVLSQGRLVAEGSAQQLADNEAVRAVLRLTWRIAWLDPTPSH